MRMQEEVSLGPLTTFGVGGKARWFAEAQTEQDVVEAVAWAKERGLPLFVLGGGSNLLVRDAGFAGLVLRMEIGGVVECGGGLLDVGAGESWDGLVDRAVGMGLAGIECLAGIPGSVGGTPVQNVGAYGQEVSETIASVRAFDRLTGEWVELDKAACRFRYRESLFNTDEPGRYVVTRVRFGLRPGGAPTLKYAELRERFGVGLNAVEAHVSEARHGAPGPSPTPSPTPTTTPSPGGLPALAEVARVVREIRHGKGMLLVEGETDCRSAGSFFKNPVVGSEVLQRVRAAADGAEVPHWPAGEGKVKLPAAWLLEKAGFIKGYGNGPVGISSRHTLALVNRGGATFADVESMEGEIARVVRERFGVRLVREPVVLG